ncbi:sugar phosphate isomerase/epimerase family protein [Halalkalibacter alkaliphilus]|uniref:Sugar phosphate isomerase/epimerase n=1 Tax=Halalkalibacter alkaliphilus TaxID=2917993 RepID=A0A9X2I840_9BACI|nr:sugar phosphate isomerase/epimerase [Halalkalibacter alkaliphilus]MCL7749767.1 sugar phosphate isomerase/epimerase [Halalkalibacter alkaliphilus]
MKFGCSLEMINMRINEPGFKHKLSKSYWLEVFKYVSAVGFKGIELPYNPYSSDGIAFNMLRSGMPISKYAINTKYESITSFLELLNHSGIEEVTSVHVNANDSMLELLTSGQDPNKVFEKFEYAAEEAIEFLAEIGGKALILSPTPEIGLLDLTMGKGNSDWKPAFLSKTAQVLNKIGESAAQNGIQATIKNEFWSLVRGNEIDSLMEELDSRLVQYSPDLAHLEIAYADSVDTVTKYKDRLNFVHFSDTNFEDFENNYKKTNPELPIVGPQRVFCDLGDGKVNLPEVYKVLENSGYDGWVICESKKTLNVYRAFLKMRWYIDNVLIKS